VKLNVLILGASYGSLLATKILMAGHRVTLVCTRETADLIDREGTRVRFRMRGSAQPLEIASRALPGALCASTPDSIEPAVFDLVVLGMQEPQYGARGVRQLIRRIARSRTPCLAIMNMPPLPYLRRIPAIATKPLEGCYTDASVWEGFDPALTTLASPDPQAFRPADEPKNVLEVGLPTNFKVARFDAEEPTALLRQLAADIEGVRFSRGAEQIEVPVKLKVHESLFVPLAKWPMLMTGNYRCIRENDMISIREAVHGDIDSSRDIYEWVVGICTKLGADPADLVPFAKYAEAAQNLQKPSAAARTLFAGATHIERVDRLVRCIARQLGEQSGTLQAIAALIDVRLQKNRELETRGEPTRNALAVPMPV
jgi:hypothetical protein